jgi:hypothetical protein
MSSSTSGTSNTAEYSAARHIDENGRGSLWQFTIDLTTQDQIRSWTNAISRASRGGPAKPAPVPASSDFAERLAPFLRYIIDLATDCGVTDKHWIQCAILSGTVPFPVCAHILA